MVVTGATGSETPKFEAAAENAFWMGSGSDPDAAAADAPVNATAVVTAIIAFAPASRAK